MHVIRVGRKVEVQASNDEEAVELDQVEQFKNRSAPAEKPVSK